MKELNEEMRDAKNNLYVTLAGNEQNKKDSLINRLGELQKEIEILHYNHFVQIEELCQPNQKEKFRELTKELANYFALPGNVPIKR